MKSIMIFTSKLRNFGKNFCRACSSWLIELRSEWHDWEIVRSMAYQYTNAGESPPTCASDFL